MKKTKRLRLIGAREGAVLVVSLLLIFVVGIAVIRVWYNASLKPLSSSTATVNFTVASGESVAQIGDDLARRQLIRSAKAFQTYVRADPFARNLQAGTYVLSPSLSVKAIVHKMTSGDVAKNYVTILPGKRLDEVAQAFVKAGYSNSQIIEALKPANYKSSPIIPLLPNGATLEGFLYPDSFQKQAETPAATIVSESLAEMNSHLTADILNGFKAQGLNAFQGVTLASIVYQETGDPQYQPTVAQVFISRLHQNMSLGSDVTAYYAAALAGQPKSVDIQSAYNTRLHTGLPPGPIGNVTAQALAAVAHPSSTNFLFFVAGDDKKIHFSATEAEHEQAIAQYCKLGCGH